MVNEALLKEPENIPYRLVLNPKIEGLVIKDLEDIIQDSFGKSVSDNYIPYLIQSNAYVYFRYDRNEDDGVVLVGAAVVIPNPVEGMPPHLVTLAVPSAYQRQGIGRETMAEILKYYPKLNWRSKPEREAANKLYKTITRDVAFFTAIDGISYNGFFVNHTPEEKQIAIAYMMHQPSHFK